MFIIFKKPAALLCVAFALLSFRSSNSIACGCGCNIFSVGNKWMMATSPGLKLSFQFSYMDQNRNWSGLSLAPADSNADKEVRTNFYTLGVQYMVDREWGVIVEAPMWNRYFSTIDDNGFLASVDHFSFGDMRVIGMYSGLSEDMSTAILFGAKLPTGSINQSLFDRDTQIGTGTTDLLLGMYHMEQESSWGWYAQAMWQYALNTKDGYRPGDSFDVNLGFHYDALANSLSIIPMLQVIGSFRGSDSGILSHPDETGYQRLFIAPGIEVELSSNIQVSADIRIPLITNITGNQLVAPSLLNASVNISF
jgi:hypothetical protein